MSWLLALFVIGSIYLAVRVLVDWTSSEAMPFACPRCHSSGSQYATWWIELRRGLVRCRACQTYFKEHPNGSLVEDRS